ncbi:MAG: hypothetical protein EZS28_013896 [Streblomastix strix]|uniref:Uncharacterized protein n=1 Tax=Streblomastix strix TaxID=222440 RepID=A0A5J4W6K7_9EUKA|nr:MAG: hypothetical protein EZS28_013896 [Streblomastix strix]
MSLCLFQSNKNFVIYGWSQERIRSFGPKFERLLYAINDSHKKITNITTHLNSPAIVCGVSEGQVRLWKLCRYIQQLIATTKENRMAVTTLRVTQDDLECVSSGSDGLDANMTSYTSYPSEANDQDCKLPRNKLHEVKLSDKELFNIAVDLSEIQFALVDVDQLKNYIRDIKVQNKVLDDRHSFHQYVDLARPSKDSLQ